MKKRQIKNRFPELDVGDTGLRYYDFNGRSMSLGQWSTMIEGQSQAVASTYVHGGNGRTYWISTVLLGVDYRFGITQGRPIIFETMVFEKGPHGIREIMGRYETLHRARKGHRDVVRGMRLMIKNHKRMYPPMLNNGRKS